MFNRYFALILSLVLTLPNIAGATCQYFTCKANQFRFVNHCVDCTAENILQYAKFHNSHRADPRWYHCKYDKDWKGLASYDAKTDTQCDVWDTSGVVDCANDFHEKEKGTNKDNNVSLTGVTTVRHFATDFSPSGTCVIGEYAVHAGEYLSYNSYNDAWETIDCPNDKKDYCRVAGWKQAKYMDGYRATYPNDTNLFESELKYIFDPATGKRYECPTGYFGFGFEFCVHKTIDKMEGSFGIGLYDHQSINYSSKDYSQYILRLDEIKKDDSSSDIPKLETPKLETPKLNTNLTVSRPSCLPGQVAFNGSCVACTSNQDWIEYARNKRMYCPGVNTWWGNKMSKNDAAKL